MKTYHTQLNEILENINKNDIKIYELKEEACELLYEFVEEFKANIKKYQVDYKELRGLNYITTTANGFVIGFKSGMLPTAKGLSIIEDLTDFTYNPKGKKQNPNLYEFDISPELSGRILLLV